MPGELHVRAVDHPYQCPQPTSFLIDVGGAAADLEPSTWALPGLTVEVDGPTEGVEIHGTEITWPPGPVELHLRVRTEEESP
jgi:hypothetical protein